MKSLLRLSRVAVFSLLLHGLAEAQGQPEIVEVEVEGVRQGGNEQSLGEPRHPNEERVPVREQRCQQAVHDLPLADDLLLDLRAESKGHLRHAFQQHDIAVEGYGFVSYGHLGS